jgi:hypothetical protein
MTEAILSILLCTSCHARRSENPRLAHHAQHTPETCTFISRNTEWKLHRAVQDLRAAKVGCDTVYSKEHRLIDCIDEWEGPQKQTPIVPPQGGMKIIHKDPRAPPGLATHQPHRRKHRGAIGLDTLSEVDAILFHPLDSRLGVLLATSGPNRLVSQTHTASLCCVSNFVAPKKMRLVIARNSRSSFREDARHETRPSA